MMNKAVSVCNFMRPESEGVVPMAVLSAVSFCLLALVSVSVLLPGILLGIIIILPVVILSISLLPRLCPFSERQKLLSA